MEVSQQVSSTSNYSLHLRETLRLSVPVIIGQIGHVMMGVIDNMMIGDLGYEYLSAASLANGIFFVVTIIGLGVAMIMAPLVAEAEGAGRARRVGQYLQQGLVVTVGLSAIMMILNYFSAYLLPFMDQPERDVELAFTYLHILGLGILPFMAFMTTKSFVDGLSLTKPAMYITLLGLGFNVFANWILIYGNLGFPRLELDGAGYGTLASRSFMMFLMLGFVYFQPRFQAYLKGWQGINWPVIYKILKLGIPSGMQWFFEVGAFVGAAIMIGWIGSAERAAHQIAISLASVSFMIVTGFSAGATIRVGDFLGKKDIPNVRRAGLSGIYLAVGFMAISAVMFVVFREFLPSLFLDENMMQENGPDNQHVLALASGLMLIAALFQVFDGTQAVGAGVLRGIQDVKVPTMITFVAYWIVALPLGYILAFPLDLGLDGIWYSFVVSLMISAGLLTRRFLKLTR